MRNATVSSSNQLRSTPSSSSSSSSSSFSSFSSALMTTMVLIIRSSVSLLVAVRPWLRHQACGTSCSKARCCLAHVNARGFHKYIYIYISTQMYILCHSSHFLSISFDYTNLWFAVSLHESGLLFKRMRLVFEGPKPRGSCGEGICECLSSLSRSSLRIGREASQTAEIESSYSLYDGWKCQIPSWQRLESKVQRRHFLSIQRSAYWGTWFARHGAILEEFVDPLQSRLRAELSWHGTWFGQEQTDILLMGQKSCVYPLRLVVYPIITGFHTS